VARSYVTVTDGAASAPLRNCRCFQFFCTHLLCALRVTSRRSLWRVAVLSGPILPHSRRLWWADFTSQHHRTRWNWPLSLRLFSRQNGRASSPHLNFPLIRCLLRPTPASEETKHCYKKVHTPLPSRQVEPPTKHSVVERTRRESYITDRGRLRLQRGKWVARKPDAGWVSG